MQPEIDDFDAPAPLRYGLYAAIFTCNGQRGSMPGVARAHVANRRAARAHGASKHSLKCDDFTTFLLRRNRICVAAFKCYGRGWLLDGRVQARAVNRCAARARGACACGPKTPN